MNFNSYFDELSRRTGPAFGAGPAGFKRLLRRLGNPQEGYRIVHVAGTNGKGSVCHLCARALEEAGYKTGLFVSPHLQSPLERISLNGRRISGAYFIGLCQTVLAAEKEKLSFFEILTAAAFLYFSRKKADFAVLETGLGGRKDPTNVCLPAACVITSVGLDHCQILGHTLRQIAREKAGIVKCGVPVFCPPLVPEAASEVKKAVCKAGASLRVVREGEPFVRKRTDWKRGVLLLQKGRAVWSLGLLGLMQTQNACLVYQLCRYLGVKDAALRKAFASVCAPGRFEMIRGEKNLFVLDGAHNPPAAEAFAAFFDGSPWASQAALVCGFMKDKDYRRMLQIFSRHFPVLYITSPGGPRAAEPERVRAALPRGTKAFFFQSPRRALQAAARAHRTVAAAGSFYLAGRLRALLTRARCARKD